ncbi:MAG TPA: hypothetical protein VK745_08165 [Polyangiaceae bacterium]|nr:hypothetical protein [Polyangiaceae bacterium]
MSLTLGCNGQLTIYDVTLNGGAPGEIAGITSANGGGAGDGVAARAGSTATSGGTSSGGNGVGGFAGDAQAGDGNTSGVGGGLAGASGAGGLAGTSGAGGLTGASGAGGVGGGSIGGGASTGGAGVACGTLIADVPADCFATVACAGTRVVDQNNVPVPANSCLEGTCNAAGTASTAPAPAGNACAAAGGGIVCDGAGKCVPCVSASNCPTGQVCSAANQCVPGSCTDVGCGGICPPCATGKKCLADADCVSFACDAVSLTCVTPQCQDHRQDGDETDADCGGGFCPSCPLSKSCVVDTDCMSLSCDAIKLICINNQCADHRTDGYETDVDCGGGNCNACAVSQKCMSSFDCQPGHFCNVMHVCQ